MSYTFETTGAGGPWDKKYAVLDPMGPGMRIDDFPDPITYTNHPASPYILRPERHKLADVAEFVVQHASRRGSNLTFHHIQARNSLAQYAPGPGRFDNDPREVLKSYFPIFNMAFFGGQLVDWSKAPDRCAYGIKVELIDRARARQLGPEAYDFVGITNTKGVGDVRVTTIYILDRRTGAEDEDYEAIMTHMLGSLAHEMIHAMIDMYKMDEEYVDRASHCTAWQLAARAIEMASVEFDWLNLKLDLGREDSLLVETTVWGYKFPREDELQVMGLNPIESRLRLLSSNGHEALVKEKAASWKEINDQLSHLTSYSRHRVYPLRTFPLP
ncbi:hypothetical protein OCU04_013062 [Sclerotinia nivalis]|uniref:SprT-like domain-containing protein n=1 Tax=Sclerotinia nivalis TaxID=352851 RepID=A0A9X0A8N6_9HELO|nr:hypothetical protein OCU04_013062 [Sclerotinia nivalis]